LAGGSTQFDAGDTCRSQIDFSYGKGYTTVGRVDGLGDEGTALQPEVSLQNALGLGCAQEALVGADLANYN